MGVIIGNDLIVRDNKIITNFRERAKSDKSLSSIVAHYKKDPKEADGIADKIIKNTYRTLLTRGMKSYHVCLVDEETKEYFQSRLRVN